MKIKKILIFTAWIRLRSDEENTAMASVFGDPTSQKGR